MAIYPAKGDLPFVSPGVHAPRTNLLASQNRKSKQTTLRGGRFAISVLTLEQNQYFQFSDNTIHAYYLARVVQKGELAYFNLRHAPAISRDMPLCSDSPLLADVPDQAAIEGDLPMFAGW